jgi:CRISPR system Cascade subunit CasD
MSTKKLYLALRLEGPLQSWGFDSQFNRRNTGLMPTKSAIAGICCAALGYPRGSEEEKSFLLSFASVRMTAIAIPRTASMKTLSVRRLQDYHTVQNTKTAEGNIKDTHITYRQYLTDAAFGVVLAGEGTLLEKIATALKHPRWGIWLGRKSCIPSAPVLAGLRENREEALRLLIGEEPIESFTRQEEVENFSEGRDSLPDQAISFDIERRAFSPRRIKTTPASGVREA